MSQSTAMRENLNDQSVEDLRSEHKELERKLEALQRPRSMSPEEESEVQRIKKRKLAIKDQIMTLEER